MTALLSIRNLTKEFPVRLGAFGERTATVHALDSLNIDIAEGETLSLVGESGCGKSTTGYCILNIQRPTSGSVIYANTDIARLDDDGDASVPARPADRVPGPLFDA
jgi:peptide/nickel transport system ATP-binding protein